MSTTGLFPRGAPRPTTSTGEQAMHRALSSGLPNGWTAWHSLRVRSESGWEGEGDFVIATPDRGMIVVEVKSGAIEVRDGQWLQNGRPMDRTPRDQGHAFARLLVQRLAERGVTSAPPFAVATAFPTCPFSNPPRQGDLDGAVIGQQDLPYLREALESMRDRLFGDRPQPRDRRWIAALHELWGETWTPRLALGEHAHLREEELVALDREQLREAASQEPRGGQRRRARAAARGHPGAGRDHADGHGPRRVRSAQRTGGTVGQLHRWRCLTVPPLVANVLISWDMKDLNLQPTD